MTSTADGAAPPPPAFDLVEIAPGAFLDSRLALIHPGEGWLAVADLHYGYELSQRSGGALFPLWGMDTLETRLLALLAHHRPRALILLGDILHSRTARTVEAAENLLLRLADAVPELVALEGNHDTGAKFRKINLRPHHATIGFYFEHGHRPPAPTGGRIRVTGHLHPGVTLRDGAGLRLRLPALLQEPERWILPAFSPWTRGVETPTPPGARLWACSPSRILPCPPSAGA